MTEQSKKQIEELNILKYPMYRYSKIDFLFFADAPYSSVSTLIENYEQTS